MDGEDDLETGEPLTSEEIETIKDIDAGALTAVLLDRVGPAVAWYRGEAARRLDLDPASFDCLDLLRRAGWVRPAVIAERTGLTRSSVSKMLRRLEEAGHVDRVGSRERGQTVEVGLRPHAERDAELARLRRDVRFRIRYVATYEVPHGDRRAASSLLRAMAEAVTGVAMRSADEAAEQRRIQARLRRDALGA